MAARIINENCKFGEVRPRKRKRFILGLRKKEAPEGGVVTKIMIISTSVQGAIRQFMQSKKSADYEVGRIFE